MGLYRIRPWPGRARRTWDPWRDMDEYRQVVEQVAALAAPSVAVPEPGPFAPDVDVYESGATVVVRIDLPGITTSDLTVALEGRALKIAGHRDAEGTAGDACLCCERPIGRFVRVLWLPAWIDAGLARATLVDGVLEIILPKGEGRSLERVVLNVEVVRRRAEPLVEAAAL